MRKQSTGEALRVSFPVAATWFGALFGPSLLSGAYAAAYYMPYGSFAVILPFVAFSVISVFAALGANIVRLNQTYDYASFAQVLYGKAYRVLMPLLDYDILMAMCLGGASCIATVSILMKSQFGMPRLLSAILFSALALLIAVFGGAAVRRFSSIMTFVMMAAFVVFAAVLVWVGRDGVAQGMSNWQPTEGRTMAQGIKGALLLGLSNFGMVGGSLCAVEQNVRTGKECRQIGLLSFLMNSVLMSVGAFMLIPFFPEMLGEATPTVSIMSKYVSGNFPYITTAYYILMFMALITSAVPQAHAVISRINRMSRRTEETTLRNERLRICLIGGVYFAVCILVSLLGLMTIVSKGYSFSAYLHIALLAIPILVWYIRTAVKRRKGAAGDI